MNSIVKFRLCTLSDEDLMQRVDETLDNFYKTGNKENLTRNIPARPNEDFDLLVGELIQRFKESLHKRV